MPNTLLFTGNAGPGIASAAAATALHSAKHGRRTLLISVGHAHSLGALLGTALAGDPREVAPRFDALAIDALAELAAAWERAGTQRPAPLAQIAGDELPLLPGLEISFGLLRLREFAPHYEVVVAIHVGQRIVVTLDPAEGYRQNSFDGFVAEWKPAARLTLVASAPPSSPP